MPAERFPGFETMVHEPQNWPIEAGSLQDDVWVAIDWAAKESTPMDAQSLFWPMAGTRGKCALN
jgi:hypothetical protein